MPNIKFNYCYRDGGNYKNHGFIIFNNLQNISIDHLQNLIKSKLIDETWFYIDQWKLPDLHFATWDNETDHTWHEFESLECTNEATNTTLNLADFINNLSALSC